MGEKTKTNFSIIEAIFLTLDKIELSFRNSKET